MSPAAIASWSTSAIVVSTSPDLSASIADHVRAARSSAGYTLDQVATLAGVSKGYLSRLESGERQPSLATLLTLSRVLDVPVSILLGEGRAATPLAIHADDQPTHTVNGLTITPHSGFAGSRALDAMRIIIEADRPPPPFARHQGEEWVYVLSGVLRLEFEAQTHLLSAGQSAHFDAGRPHRLGAHRHTTEMLLVAVETPNDIRQAHQYTS